MFSDFSFAQDTVGFIIEGKMDRDAMDRLIAMILEKLEQHDYINLYLEDASVQQFTFDAINTAFWFPHKYKDRLRKVALVTDRKWIHALGGLNNMFLSTAIKNFPTQERMDAMCWIAKRS